MLFDPKNLAAGIQELRAVAKRLNAWADDLEKAGAAAPEAPEASSPVTEAASAPAAKPAPVPAAATANPVPPVPTAPYDPLAVKKFLVFICAHGYSNQVKALIESYGAKILSGVPAEAYDDIVNTMLPMYEAAVQALTAKNADGGDIDEA